MLTYECEVMEDDETMEVTVKTFQGFRGFQTKRDCKELEISPILKNLFLEIGWGRPYTVWQIEDMKSFKKNWKDFGGTTPPILLPLTRSNQ